MSEKYVAEYVEIIDGHGERKGVCVTDTEHTVSFEVKDENVAMELCDLLNELSEENGKLKKAEKINMEYAEQILEESKKLRIAKNDLRIENEQLRKELKDIKENPINYF